MKTLFKLIIFICLFVGVTEASAQTYRKKYTVDIRFGLNFASMDIPKSGTEYNDAGRLISDYERVPKLGAIIGLYYNYKIISNFQLQTGFFITKKGLKTNDYLDQHNSVTCISEILKIQQNSSATYAQVPFCLGFESYLSKTFAINMHAGVYGAYGIKGSHYRKGTSSVYNFTPNPITGEEQVVVESTTQINESRDDMFAYDGWKRFDYGLLGSVGFVYDIYALTVSYEYGLAETLPASSARQMKNRTFTAALGFRF